MPVSFGPSGSETLLRMLVAFVFLPYLLIAWAFEGFASTKRVALVVGNAAYVHAPALRNPRNDAQDVASVLESHGFTVIVGLDLPHVEMGRLVRRLAAALDGASAGVFFYAGHGVQINGVNYLVPTDSRLEDEHSPDFELIRVDVVQRIMENRCPQFLAIPQNAPRELPAAKKQCAEES